MTNNANILLRNGYVHGYVHVPSANEKDAVAQPSEALATILMNLEYYGFSLSPQAFEAVRFLTSNALNIWWLRLEPELKAVTGNNHNIGDFVVYKNFPAEVLSKTEAEYWIPQILMYWGLPNELFTEPVEPREGMNPAERKSITLMPSGPNTLQSILNSLLSAKEGWKAQDFEDAVHLAGSQYIDFSKIQFKENLVKIAAHFVEAGAPITVKTATDVLRLAAGLSDGDVSLRTRVRFKSFSKKTRRFLMGMLENCTYLAEDVARRPNVWKKFLHRLHPGDFKKSHPRVLEIAGTLYKDKLYSFSSHVERMIAAGEHEVFESLSTRPGEFMRRLVHLLDVYGDDTVEMFTKVIPELSVQQIVTIRKFLETANMRQHRVFAPRGKWSKLQIGEARPVDIKHVKQLSQALGSELSQRVSHVSVLDPATKCVKLPNGSDEGSYARGTVFRIPDHVKFVRTASYWSCTSGSAYNVWYDNGWNFFDSDWKTAGAICWNEPKFALGNKVGAAFSGDPTNSKDSEGRAAQLIDLYLDELKEMGVRYAVWNVLCFSQIPFSQAKEVFAALQWGEEAQKGKLFEPSRAQLAFPLTGEYHTKFVCMVDLETREMVYLDANLKANVQSAGKNGEKLSEQLPAYLEYLHSLPSVHDLFRNSVHEDGTGQVLYTDKNTELDAEQPAYVFQHEGDTDFQPIDLNEILSG